MKKKLMVAALILTSVTGYAYGNTKITHINERIYTASCKLDGEKDLLYIIIKNGLATVSVAKKEALVDKIQIKHIKGRLEINQIVRKGKDRSSSRPGVYLTLPDLSGTFQVPFDFTKIGTKRNKKYSRVINCIIENGA